MLGSMKRSTCSVPARKVLLETGLWLCSICQVTCATRRSHVHLGGFNLKADLPMFYIYLILMWRSEDSNDSLSNLKRKVILIENSIFSSRTQRQNLKTVERDGRAWEQFSKKISLFWWVCINSVFFLEKLKLFLFLLCVHLLECL